jgi:large subunit ribosomal protein L4
MRRAAVRSALSVKASENAVVVVDNIVVKEPKSKLLANSVKKLVGDHSALLVVPEKDSKIDVLLSADNLSNVKVLLAKYLNIKDMLTYDRIVIEEPSIKIMESYLKAGKRAK